MQDNHFPVTVYLEDTDAQGIVYHANYLKYCERARTEMLRLNGYSLGEMQTKGILFVVFEMHLRFQRPARLHDALDVHSTAIRSSDYRLTFKQELRLEGAPRPLFVADVTVVTIDNAGQLCPLPEDLMADGATSELP
jgi:tol-pal system-associated acyl-CoA thioesterase